jgi:predicted secreted acid phosphatase
MKKSLLNLLLATALIGLSPAYALQPQNLDITKHQLMQYHDSGAYAKDEAKVIAQAKKYIKTRSAKPSQKKIAMVLDIDETSLSNYNDMLTLGFGGKIQDINDAEGMADDTVIQPTLELYNLAKKQKVAVFFITGRTERYREATIKNLKSAGYENWDGLILKPEEYKNKSASPYKIAMRKKITDDGYTIIVNVGDQQSDLVGGYSEKTFQLPNPYYFIP